MTMSDPIADMLTRIRNATIARFNSVDIPGSKLKAELADVLRNEGFIKNCKFIKDDKQGIVRHALVNDLPLGRNVDEALRVLKALQFTEEYGEVCPANWQEGEDAMRPTSEGVAEYLAKHV